MSRPLRVDFPGAAHHVIARGNERRPIFFEVDDRARFLLHLEHTAATHRILVHAYCLMGNHYHLLLECPEANLSLAMHTLNGRHAQGVNRRHRRVGHLFQGRFASRLVQKERYLLGVCRYILLNPVRARLAGDPAEWRWSSYRATAGLCRPAPFLTIDWILERFHPCERRAAIRGFREFIRRDGAESDRLPPDWATRAILGDEEFLEALREPLRPAARTREIRTGDRLAGRPPLERLLSTNADRDGRNEEIRRAIRDHGYRAVEVARRLGLHESTISKILSASGSDSRFKT